MSILECQGLRNRRSPSIAGVDLCLDDGDIAGLSGASGSGKTLLLRAIADLDPSDGEVVLQGQARSAISGPQWRQRVAYLAAEPVWWAPSVGQHFSSPPVDDDLKALHLSPAFLGRAPLDLSTGERQRLALLRALALSPRVLLLDEPTSALDQESTRAIEQFVESYVTDQVAAALWVSHDAHQLARICDPVYTLQEGSLAKAIIEKP